MFLERRANGVRLRLNQAPPENECRPAADVLFRSVADIFGPRAMAIVLTGMGIDGPEGSRRIQATGGRVLVQDQASSTVWSMPGQVANAGLADAVLPISQLSFDWIRRLAEERTGNVLDATKTYLVETRLAPVVEMPDRFTRSEQYRVACYRPIPSSP